MKKSLGKTLELDMVTGLSGSPSLLRHRKGKRRPRVALGLSGGVDSAVAGAMLLEQGYDVTGVFIICYSGPGCRSDADRKDALDVALKLGIPFEVVDYRKEYQDTVLSYFKAEYKAGRTPNPDVLCNKEIKFGLFYDWAMDHQFDFIATGHYARILRMRENSNVKIQTSNQLQNSKFTLLRAVDEIKDQSYFLYQIKQVQLAHILFPIGEMTKQEVREKAVELQLPVANKPDSQGICFVGEVSVPEFLKIMGVNEQVGQVVAHSTGKVIGYHKGAWFYTIGQRHGFRIENLKAENRKQKFDRHNFPPLYVIDKDVTTNTIVVGTREEAMRESFGVEEIHWVNESLKPKIENLNNLRVRIRHGGELLNSKFEIRNSKLKVLLAKPAFGVAPGQAAVFYKDNEVAGGGVIA